MIAKTGGKLGSQMEHKDVNAYSVLVLIQPLT